MAKTGIKITTTDTVLGAPIDVNTTSMLVASSNVFTGSSGLDDGDVISGRSLDELVQKGLEADTVFTEFVKAYFSTDGGVDVTGNLVWVAYASSIDHFKEAVRATTVKSFDERPRQIAFCVVAGADNTETPSIANIAQALSDLAMEGIRCVAITSQRLDDDDCNLIHAAEAASVSSYPFVAKNVMGYSRFEEFVDSDIMTGAAIVARDLAAISVGTSIGDGGREPMQQLEWIPINDNTSDTSEMINVKSLTQAELDVLGESQLLFTRTRPPRNGVWWNDGATCNSPENALSTLEAARTICAMADDLQSFFVPYINTRVPVTSTGDIQSAYKQVVLDNARAAVVQKYIESGDISDARINLVAKDNDMIGTRTWEVTLSILPAPTLRWIDGYVFYVKSL